METSRIIIAGGRGFSDFDLLCRTCDRYLSRLAQDYEITIISGGARGADALGERYARERGLRVARFPADWEAHGRSAGYRRNVTMAENADCLIAFWDGASRGTKHMIDTATARGLKVRVVRY